MRVMLLQPVGFYGKDLTSGTKYPPLSLIYLGGSLIEKGHDVKIIDPIAEGYKFNDVLREIKKFNPEIVGITSTTSDYPNASKLADMIKGYNKNVKVILGGIHPTVLPNIVLENKNIDYVIRNEGEETVTELLEKIEKGKDVKNVLGISYRKGGEILHNFQRPFIKDLDDIPFPAYDLLPKGKYMSPYVSRLPFMTMVTSRGCPYQCIFCAHHHLFGHKYRFHSPKRTLKEIKYLIDKFGIKEISFKDSEFTLNKKRVIDFSKLMNKSKLDVIWACNGRINHVNLEILKAMKSAGCTSITYGVEAGSQRILDVLKKQITIDQVRKTMRITKKVGLKVVLNFMIGNPYEKREDIEKTIKLCKELNPDYGYFGFTTPFPGTELREMAIKNKWIINEDWDSVRYERLMMNATELSVEELSTYLNKAYKSFYFNPKFILKRINPKNLTMRQIKNNIEGLKAIIKNTLTEGNR